MPDLYKGFQPPSPKTLTMEIGTAMFSEKLENVQYTTQIIPESRSYTLKTRRNLKTRIIMNIIPASC
jgi:hypothetical protein